MMFYFLFTILWISPPNVYCNYTDNSTVLNDTKTEIATLSKPFTLTCPQLSNNPPVKTIIWKFDKMMFPIPINAPGLKPSAKKYKGDENGSLIFDKIEYSDAKQYECHAYGGELLYVVRINLIVRGPPDKVNNFQFQALGETVLKFKWDINQTMSKLVQFFNLTLCKSLITKDCETVTLPYPNYSYTFKNLKPFSEYRSSIIAFNEIGASERSDLNARTLPGTPTARPYILKKDAASRNVSLIIECMSCLDPEQMKGILQSFRISYHDGYGENNLSIPSNNSSRLETTIQHLHPYRNFTFYISAYNGVKYGPVDSISCRTKEDYPNPIDYITPTAATADKIRVRWNLASDRYGPITGYLIKIFDSSQHSTGNNSLESRELGRNVNTYEFENLKSRTSFNIYIWAINSVGRSSSQQTMGKTDRKRPFTPHLVMAGVVGKSIRVSWQFPFSDNHTKIFSYRICYNYHLSSKIEQCITVPQDSKDPFPCNCLYYELKHSVDIPFSTFALNESEVFLWVKILVPSDLCENAEECSQQLESRPSTKQKVKLKEFLKYTKHLIETPGHHALIIGLGIGISLFALGFLCALLVCKNCGKTIFFSSRRNLYYSRPTGEYIEVCTRQQSVAKILPLEKCPYPPILMSNLIEHINSHRADDGAGFQAEFENIESMDTSKWSITYALLKENKSKNRYTNIFPYDHSRVILQNSAFGKFDYINASFIDGFQRPYAYIATQGPLADTVADFWQMVWEQNSEIIVMISNFVERGRSKCEMYWSSNKILNCGNISVRQIYQKEMAFYTERRFRIRNIRIKKNTKERTVYHYQYTDWRDFDVPPSSLPVLVFVRATTKHWLDSSGPIIVHCSAGVGRTGTYICIESQIRKLDMEHQINVRGFLEHIRQQRMKLVQTESQYTFIHDALYEYFLYPDREIHKHELSAYISKLKEIDSSGYMKLDTQFKKCINFEPTDYDYMESKKRYNIVKNRSDIIMPIESRRINLSTEPGVEGSNYINASAIQGYWQMKEFIITQHPLDETEQDFWKMVWDENCSLIILLSNENMHQFWPEPDNNARTFRWFKVAQCNCEDTNYSVKYNFLLSSSREDFALDCTMHCLKSWPDTIGESGELLQLLFEVNSKKYNGPIVVIDEYGSSRAGIFVAMSSLLHQLRNDDVVNVYFVMKMIHIERPHTFSNRADLLFIYELLEHVVNNQHSYIYFRNHQDFIPNGFAHLPLNHKPVITNNVSSTHYSTIGTTRSKSSMCSSRRRASSVDSEPFGLQTPSPNKKEMFGNRVSWNVGESRHNGTPLLSDSFIDWSNSTCNGHFSGPNTNASFENTHLNDLPVAKITSPPPPPVVSPSLNQQQSSLFNLTNNGALDTSTSSSTVWCTQEL